MNIENETCADIAAALRQEAEDCPYIERAVIYNRYADRIEAAAKREAEKLNSGIQAQRSAFDAEQDRQRRECPGNAVNVHRFNAEKLGMPFYVDVGTSIVAIRCTCNHEVVWSVDHGWSGKGQIDEARRICAIMNDVTKHPIGNAAKLREAVVNISRYADCAAMRPNDAQTQEYIEQIRKWANAALAAPPRNCDMPLVVDGPADNNTDKAWLVFKKHNPDAYFDVSGLLRCIDWILATATEQKGATDGSK